jgi:hypothetical protein
MAINKNHLFDDLNGVKCAIVESNISDVRAQFLKSLLEFNKYKVIIVPEAPPKAPAAPPAPVNAEIGSETTSAAAEPVPAPEPPTPTAFKIGVTDVSFNVTNAIFGRLLHTKDKRVVTMAYWLQKEEVSHDEIPYFDRKF